MSSNIVAIDVGEKRIGVAVADAKLGFARPLTTLLVDGAVADQLATLLADQHATHLVVGVPRTLEGKDDRQAQTVRDFVAKIPLPDGVLLAWQDETLTSVKAEDELRGRGKPYKKEDVDALAATYILEDYLKEQA